MLSNAGCILSNAAGISGRPDDAALITGTLTAIGFAIVYLQGSSSGGIDFLSMALKAIHPHINLGTINFVLDMFIILAGAMIFKDMDGIVYGMIINFLCSTLKDWPTAFRAVYSQGQDGPRIGLLCEYDALRGLGHGCGHHLQGPSICGAAVALKNANLAEAFTVVVYGTPAEETRGAKITLLENGYFQDIDLALMMHGGPDTCVDEKSLALSNYLVTFHGVGAHAALAPDKGKSALDALLLAFNGIEFLREHVRDDVRMHYTIKETPGPTNVVPAKAVGEFSMRSYSREVLNEVCRRFEQIVQGACLMADVTCDITKEKGLDNKIPCYLLNQLLMDNAKDCGAPGLGPVRKKTGSTDFGNVTNRMPGCCIRVKFVPEGTSSHSQIFVDAGKTKDGHDAVLYGAKILAATALDIITTPDMVDRLWADFREASKHV